jgi:hypothetical protein
MDYVKLFANKIDDGAQAALRNPYIMAVLKITLALYAAQIAPRLPTGVSAVFANTFFKIFALTIMVYVAEHDFQLAIILAVAFVIGSNLLSGRGFLESFADIEPGKPYGDMKLIEPKTMVYPGCQDIKIQDLYEMFDNDALKMQTTVQYIYQELLANMKTKTGKETLMKIAYATGLPYNKTFTDEDAPYIATLLMYHGFKLGDKCVAPQQ